MEFNKNGNSYHIVRRVGQQGARCSVGDQVDNEKYATGRKHLQLRNKVSIGTWNVRKFKELGKLNSICNEMSRLGLQILGISETNCNGKGSFKTGENQMVIFSGKEDSYSHGVAVVLDKDSSRTLIEYSPVSDRILKVRIHAKPFNISIVQCYALTINANDEEMESFYDILQETLNTIPSRDVKFIIGDLNAKVGKIVTPNTA